MINRNGKVYSEVISLERERSFDLILIGAHSSTGWSPMWIGSNAFKVVSSSNCPVITIRDTVEEAPKLDYLMPLADSSNSRQKVPYTAAMAKAFGATVHILGVSKSNSNDTEKYINVYINQAVQYFEEHGVKYTVSKKLGVKVPETCIEEAEKHNCGLITIMTETESSGLFMDSYSQQLINTSPIPVMSIHARDTKVAGNVGY
jgi:nucleotide-binding universal stress UspA family protein